MCLQDPRFDKIVEALELQKRGSAGEHTEAVDDTYDLSNAARLKKTEVGVRLLERRVALVQSVVTITGSDAGTAAYKYIVRTSWATVLNGLPPLNFVHGAA